jgi:RNA recognition motif-containing protein
MTTIYVGNLPFTATEDEVRSLFERYGKVDSVKLINDRETGRPRGFAFVDMAAGPSAGPTGGLGFACPAGICSLM